MISNDKIDKAITLIKKNPVNADYFFEKLNSPDWIEPLERYNLFSTPYPAERHGDSISFPLWPPGDYLARMARLPGAQEQVVQIFEQLPRSDNPRVYESIANAVNSLPPRLMTRLVPQLLAGLELPFQLLLPERVANVIVRLAEKDLHEYAMKLASSLFTVIPWSEDYYDVKKARMLQYAKSRLRDWEYGKLLRQCASSLIKASPLESFEFLCTLLKQSIAVEQQQNVDASDDYSYIWRPTIERSEGHHSSVKDYLVTEIRDAGNQIAKFSSDKFESVIFLLWSYPEAIFRRIALFLLIMHGDRHIAVAQNILKNPNDWDDIALRPEYEQALSRFFGELDEDVQQGFLEWLDQSTQSKSTEKQGDFACERDVWIRNRLAAITKHPLPFVYRKKFDDLVKKLGPAPSPGPMFRTFIGWRGEKSPLTDEETLSLDWPSIIAKTQNWAPRHGDLDSPSTEGLAGSIQRRVIHDPTDAARHLKDAVGIQPQYVAAILEGFRQVIREEISIEWVSLVEFLEIIVSNSYKRSDEVSRWQWVRQCAAALVEDGFNARPVEIPITSREPIWKILELLAEDEDPTPEHEVKYGGTNMDPMTLSLNTIRGRAFHGIFQYSLWWRRYLETLPDDHRRLAAGFEELPEVQKILMEHLDISVDPSVAVRATYGRWFPWIVILDHTWASTNAPHIFDHDKRMFWAAWGAYVVFCPPYTNVLPILRDVYNKAIHHIDNDDGIVEFGVGGEPHEHLAQHIMAYYWRGEITLAEDGLVAEFFKTANAKLRGYALEWIGRILMQLEEPLSPEIESRLIALWEWRDRSPYMTSTEAQAFGWWFGSGKIKQEWTFQTLEHILADSVLPEPDHLVVERLAVIVETLPNPVIRCLERMIDLDGNGWSIHGWLESARTILEVALKSPELDTRERAERVVHRLGALQFRDFRNLLQKKD